MSNEVLFPKIDEPTFDKLLDVMDRAFPRNYEAWCDLETQEERDATFVKREPFILVPITFDGFLRFRAQGDLPYNGGTLQSYVNQVNDELRRPRKAITEDDQL